MKFTNKILLIILLMLNSIAGFAQSGMEEYFYQSGKIKVVIAIAAIVLTGIFIYLFMLDRRLRKLEKKD